MITKKKIAISKGLSAREYKLLLAIAKQYKNKGVSLKKLIKAGKQGLLKSEKSVRPE